MIKFLKVLWGIFAVIGIRPDADTFWAAPTKANI